MKLSMFGFLTRLKRSFAARRLRKTRIPEQYWQNAVSRVEVLRHLGQAEQHRLRVLASQFLHTKTISGAAGLFPDENLRILIAAQACLLILNLDMSYYDGWHEVIVYPDTFVVRRETYDAAGLVREVPQALGGEAWSRGPVILSWADARPGAHPHGEGSNVILHEFAHKLDMLNGAANGMPPLHKTMSREIWTRVFQRAYDELQQRLANQEPSMIDPYAAENPAEFFSVCSELFFENPLRLLQLYPELYDQLRLFYRQDPVKRH